jgi:hypothetical protein
MNKLIATASIALASLAAVAMTDRAASAVSDSKLYPAFLCSETGTGGGGTVNKNEVRITKSSGGVDEVATVLCPLVHERGTYGGAFLNTARVQLLDTILNKDVTCSLNFRSPQQGVEFFQSASTSGVSSAVTTLEFLNPVYVGTVATGDAYYYIQCALPTNQGAQVVKLFSYEATEVN